MLKSLLFIFVGGGIGSVMRYLLHFYIHKSSFTLFPIGTLLANALASFLVGFLAEKVNHQVLPIGYKYLLITGFCGGLSTFSTFSYENMVFITQKQFLISILYTLISLILCFSFTFLGMAIGKKT